jgi:two-component system, chemotaxis family, sensor kinase CheA
VVVLAAGRKRIAFVVDEVLYEQEVLVKSLGKQLSRVRNIAGATILGSGKVVPVLNVSDLMKSALSVTSTRQSTLSAQEEQSELRKSVLVVEDSITARSLLKGILESAGYQVVTAIDGIDGLTQLRSGEFGQCLILTYHTDI